MIYLHPHAPVFAVTSFSFMFTVVANTPSGSEVMWATRSLVLGGRWLGKSESSKLCIGLSVLQAVFMIALLELIFLLHLQSPFCGAAVNTSVLMAMWEVMGIADDVGRKE